MALTVYIDKLKSNMAKDSDEKKEYIAVKCDSSYATGGYSLDVRQYFSSYNFVQAISNQQPYQGYWDQNTKKLLVTTMDGTEVANGTDLSSVYFFIVSYDIVGMPSPDMLPTAPVQAGSGSNALLKVGDTSKTSGTLTLPTGTAIDVNAGATQTVSGMVKESTGTALGAGPTPSVAGGTFFVLDGSVTGAITNFSGGVEGQVIAILCTVAGTTITHDATKIDLAGDTNNVMKVGDKIVLKNYSGVWKQEVVYNKDGTTTVASGGSVTVDSGGVVNNSGVVANPTTTAGVGATLDANAASYYTIQGATTPTISGISGGYEGAWMGIYVESGTCTVVEGATIDLKKDQSYVMKTGDSLTLQKHGAVWVEWQRDSKSGKIMGDFEEQPFNTTINMSPTASDIFHIAVTNDCTINMTTTVAGLTIIIVLENDATPRTVAFGTNTTTSGSIVGQANKIASITLYCNGTTWLESSRKEGLG